MQLVINLSLINGGLLQIEVWIIFFGCDSLGRVRNFFNKYWPELIERKMLYKVETPILVAYSKKNKKQKRNNAKNESFLNILLNNQFFGFSALVKDKV